MSATTAAIVKCDGCAAEFVHVVQRGTTSLLVGRAVAEMRGWKVAKDRSGRMRGSRRGEDYCPACVTDGVPK